MSTETGTIGKKLSWVKGKKPANLFEIPNQNTIPYLSASYFRTKKPDYYTDIKDKNCVPVSADEVVLIWDGSNAGDVFCGLKGALSSTMVKFKKSEECDTKFLYFLLKNNFKNLNRHTTGSTIPHVSGSVLKDIKIPFSSLPEQKLIARVLTVVQEAIAGQEELIAKLKELKRGMMQYLFTHGTKSEKTKMTEIGEVPESWEIEMLGEIADIQQGKQVSKKNRIGDNQKPFLRTANVFWNKIDLSELDEMNFSKEEEKKFQLNYGDLLICEGGDVGRTAMWKNEGLDCYYQNHLHRVRVSQKINSNFLMQWLNYALEYTDIYLGRANNTTIPNLSKSKLQQFEIPIPDIKEQNKISDFFVNTDKKIDIIEEKLSAYKNLFKTLLHELMSGERRVKI